MIETKLNLAMHFWKSLSDEERNSMCGKWVRVLLEIALKLLEQRNDYRTKLREEVGL